MICSVLNKGLHKISGWSKIFSQLTVLKEIFQKTITLKTSSILLDDADTPG